MRRLSMKLVSTLVVLCMLMALIPCAAFAEEFEQYDSMDCYGVVGDYYETYWTAPDGEDIFDFDTASEYYPDGIAIHKSSNDSFVIEGTPREAGTFWVTAYASTADHDYTIDITLTFENGGYDKPETYDSASLNGKVGKTLSGWRWGTLDGEYIGSLYISEGYLPDGLYIPTPGSDAFSIEGTPTYAGSGSFTVTVETGDDIYYVQVYYNIDAAEEKFEVTKSPTTEYTSEGGSATFIAGANYYNYVEWLLISNGTTVAIFDGNVNTTWNGCTVITYHNDDDGREYLVLRDIPASMDGYRIQARFTNTKKATSILTQACGLSVDAPPLAVPAIISAPAGADVNVGNNVKLSVVASDPNGGTLNYQWYSNTSFSLNGATSIAGATQASYIPSQTVGTMYYYCSVVSVKNGQSSASTVTTPVAVTYRYPATGIVVKAGETTETYSYSDITQVSDYLYEVTFNDYTWDDINEYYNVLYQDGAAAGGCSGVQYGAIRGRNLDWNMDDEVEFIVHVPAAENRHASIGIASLSHINRDEIASGQDNENYKYLVFKIVDGMNDAGLCTQVNILPVEDCAVRTTGTNPGKETMMVACLQRYILDYASSVDEAVELIKGLNLYAPASDSFNQEFHFMISDPKKCVVVEFVNNQVVVIENQNIITNYYLSSDQLTPHAEGVERYNILAENYALGSTAEGMMSLMKKVWFTQAYTLTGDAAWYSDFTGGSLTNSSPKTAFASAMQADADKYKTGERNADLWITTHTCVYDQNNLTLDVMSQQQGTVYHYDLKA